MDNGEVRNASGTAKGCPPADGLNEALSLAAEAALGKRTVLDQAGRLAHPFFHIGRWLLSALMRRFRRPWNRYPTTISYCS